MDADANTKFATKAGGAGGRKRKIRERPQEWKPPSLDDLFAYETKKIVKILDRRLGMLHISVQLLIVFYIVVGVLIAGGGYLAREKARGSVSTVVSGKTYAKTPEFRLFDQTDALDPPLEPGAVFIPTRIVLTAKQEQAVCKTTKPCKEKN